MSPQLKLLAAYEAVSKVESTVVDANSTLCTIMASSNPINIPGSTYRTPTIPRPRILSPHISPPPSMHTTDNVRITSIVKGVGLDRKGRVYVNVNIDEIYCPVLITDMSSATHMEAVEIGCEFHEIIFHGYCLEWYKGSYVLSEYKTNFSRDSVDIFTNIPKTRMGTLKYKDMKFVRADLADALIKRRGRKDHPNFQNVVRALALVY